MKLHSCSDLLHVIRKDGECCPSCHTDEHEGYSDLRYINHLGKEYYVCCAVGIIYDEYIGSLQEARGERECL